MACRIQAAALLALAGAHGTQLAMGIQSAGGILFWNLCPAVLAMWWWDLSGGGTACGKEC